LPCSNPNQSGRTPRTPPRSPAHPDTGCPSSWRSLPPIPSPWPAPKRPRSALRAWESHPPRSLWAPWRAWWVPD